ncbi:MAG TPA: hypothetical protein VMY37_01110 [Thermoguttaceae bacterium]|nr:hypothetical protein [Thermoguttaceae bacterium]
MFTGLPGGSPGPGARAGCGGLILIFVVSLIGAALLLAMLLYATSWM